MNGKKAKRLRREAAALTKNFDPLKQAKTEGLIEYKETRIPVGKDGGEYVTKRFIEGVTRTLDGNGFKKINRTLKKISRYKKEKEFIHGKTEVFGI